MVPTNTMAEVPSTFLFNRPMGGSVDVSIASYLGGKPSEPTRNLDIFEAVKNGRKQQRPHVRDNPDADGPPSHSMQPEIVGPPAVQKGLERLHLGEVVPRPVTHGREHQPLSYG